MSVFSLYKPMGWTPLQAIEALKSLQPELKETPMTYAGRLDPMAEGVLIVLSGEDRFHHDTYLNHEKIYRAKFLLGFTSDSLDVLGRIQKHSSIMDEKKILEAIKNLQGNHQLPFPVYSSYKVQGKPLHWWAQQNRLDEITIPKKEMMVMAIHEEKMEWKSSQEILRVILSRIALVKGDFRQKEISEDWKQLLTKEESLLLVSATFEVTSGTYIRSLAQKLGEDLGCGALLLHLERIQVGPYKKEGALKFPFI